MENQLVPATDVLEMVVADGNLEQLTPAQRVNHYVSVCKSIGVNPLTQPFEYIKLNGKLVLYAKRTCTDQLRHIHQINVTIASREMQDDIYVVTAHAQTPDGRADESIGAVSVARLQADARANALMKAETKAKRRVTLSIVGLGWLDETELVTIPSAQVVTVNHETGEIVEPELSQAIAANGDYKGPPFASTPDFIGKFWGECRRKMNGIDTKMPDDELKARAHEALGYAHIAEFPGNLGEAFKRVDEYVATNQPQ